MYMSVGNIFEVALNMKNQTVYGWNANEVDTHMMKNSEWGAVAYLSKSIYGANNEIWINNTNYLITGCAGPNASAYASNICQNAYNTVNGQKASTTYNIYGVYDMSGGAYEYTAAYVNNAHANLITYGSAILDADIRYKNIYSVGATDSQLANYNANKNVIGDAIYETSSSYSGSNSWYGDSSFMPYTSYIWFARGGNYSDQAKAGLFAYASSFGNATTNHTFRPVVIVTK